MLAQSLVNAVLREALRSGGDFAELFVEDRDAFALSALDGRIESATTQRDYGAGIRILMGTRSVYAFSNDTSEASLMRTAKQAAAALGKMGEHDEPIVFASSTHQNRSPILIEPKNVAQSDKAALLSRAASAAKDESSEIAQVSCNYADVDQRVLIANSEGLWTEDRRIRTRIAVVAVASNGTEFETGSDSPGRSMGFEVFQNEIDMEESARQAARQAVVSLHAEKCPAGVFPVVIEGGFGGVIFHEACGHSLEATSVGKGNSVFCGKLGEKIASDRVTAVDDGTLANAWGTLNVDDEGMPTQRNVLIENGILKGYLIDRLGARRMQMPTTGSGRRQDYSFAPTSRMNNTYIDSGSDDNEEMIDSMAEGLYAKRMGGGSVNPLTGEFNFAVTEGYWVKNGDMRPVRGATLIGKGHEVLLNIDRVGQEVEFGAGMCGSLSGSVPVNVGQPRIRVSEMTIGGQGEALN